MRTMGIERTVSVSDDALMTLLIEAKHNIKKDPICYCRGDLACFTCYLIEAIREGEKARGNSSWTPPELRKLVTSSTSEVRE